MADRRPWSGTSRGKRRASSKQSNGEQKRRGEVTRREEERFPIESDPEQGAREELSSKQRHAVRPGMQGVNSRQSGPDRRDVSSKQTYAGRSVREERTSKKSGPELREKGRDISQQGGLGWRDRGRDISQPGDRLGWNGREGANSTQRYPVRRERGEERKLHGSSDSQTRRNCHGQGRGRVLGYRKLQQLRTKEASEITLELLSYRESFQALVSSVEMKEDWITLLVLDLGKMCAAKMMPENLIKVLSVLRNSVFLREHLPKYILQLPFVQGEFEPEELDELLRCMVALFKEWFVKFPQACYDIPIDMFRGILEDIHSVDDLQEVTKEIELLLEDRKKIMMKERKQEKKVKDGRTLIESPPPNDFRELSIFPDIEEILSNDRPFLRRNKTDGAYKDLQDYLDVQFRLLREDFVAPLRNGIREIVNKTPKGQRSEDLYIYENVNVLNAVCTKSGIVHRIALDRQQIKGIPWEHCRRLLYGSFVCFSADRFKTTMHFATVANRKAEDLKKGHLEIRFVESLGDFPKSGGVQHNLTMVESPAYFESYRHVLSRLQGFKPESFPFQKYLVKCSNDVQPPAYIRHTNASGKPVSYDLGEALGDRSVRILEPCGWTAVEERQTQLNDSQLRALKTALTKEFAVIQGPPGTGKTFVGLKIVQALLDNRRVWDPERTSPMLMVCYTNHALDQFLEGVLRFQKTGVIRVGGRSSSEMLEEHNLKNHLTHSDGHRLLSDLRTCQESWEKTQNCLESSMHRILSLKWLESLAMKRHLQQFKCKEYSYTSGIVSVVEGWLGIGERTPVNVVTEVQGQQSEAEEAEEADNIDIDREADIIENQRSLGGHKYERIQGAQQSSAVREKERTGKRRGVLSDDELKILRGQTSIRPLSANEVAGVQDVWTLAPKIRWRLYLFWLRIHQRKFREEILRKTRDYEDICKRWAEIRENDEYEVLRNAVVIGMTTTGAAKYHGALEHIQPRIVVVEEAAEVLEAHIIASLTQGTQHLILIGDHKQLRPNPQVYKLSIEYNLDVSLFERMLKSGMQCNLLNTQHRMQPQISSLMKFIYTDLEDHESVHHYDNIEGVSADMYFIEHQFYEDKSDVNSRLKSHSNQHEAEFIVSLCEYFLHQGYEPGQITVLTMYTGQLLKLRKMMPRVKFEGIRVTAVDNFQGEENDIILLSLVRSNQEGKIGFLGVDNRICVALSRARMGFYCIGNFRLLEKKSGLWANIVGHMHSEGALGTSLRLICRNHPDMEIDAKTAQDFKRAPEGGCTRPCQFRMRCGHVCERACHPVDTEHVLSLCRKDCLKELCQLHGTRCDRKCHHGDLCEGCPEKVQKVLQKCGHKQSVPCGVSPENFSCQATCQRRLRCNHPCPGKCSDDCATMECHVVISIEFLCGHVLEGPCVEISEKDECREPCVAMLDCLHPCPGNCTDCRRGRMHVPCKEPCERMLVCQHVCAEPCTKNCPPCTEPCANRCFHSKCPKQCSEPCASCKEPCNWRCRHYRCTRLCGEKCNRPRCDKPCLQRLKACNHPCIGLCGEQCPKLCRICHKDKVTEIFFGNEDEPDARFIELMDCEHVFEFSGMDHWMDPEPDSDAETSEDMDIKLKECPLCKTPIRCSHRYSDVVKQKLADIEAVKERMLREERKLEAKMRGLKKEMEDMGRRYPATCKGRTLAENENSVGEVKYERDVPRMSVYRSIIFEPGSWYAVLRQWLGPRRSMAELTTIQNQIELLRQMCKVRKKAKTDLRLAEEDVNVQQKSREAREETESQLDMLEETLMSYQISEQELGDISDELLRVGVLLNLRVLKCGLLKSYALPISYANGNLLKEVESQLTTGRRLSEEVISELEGSINQIRKHCGLDGLTKEERVMIVKAMDFSQGHWYKCPNGHIYAIGDCGGAMEERKCPDCDATIGGAHHVLQAGNQVATEMDGSKFGAWSPQANMQNYDPEQLRRLQIE